MLLHEFGHVEAHQRALRSKQERRQAARHLGFADARRTQEKERAHGPARGLESRTRAPDGPRQGGDRLVLADDALVELVLDAQQLRHLFLFDRGHRDAGPARHHLLNVLARNHAHGRFVDVVLLAQQAQVLPLLAFLVGVEARFLEFVAGDGTFHSVDHELDPLLHVDHLFGHGTLAQLHTGPRLIDEVNCFIRQVAVGNVTAGIEHGRPQGVVGIGDGMELFVAVLDAKQDLNGVVLVRRRHLDGLEAPFKRSVSLNRFTKFRRRRGADALNLAAGKRRLEDIGRVERPFRRPRPHQGVQFVDEDDGVLRLHQFLHDGLQALLKLAAVFRARHNQGQVEAQDALVG